MIFALRAERKQKLASDAVTIDQVRDIAAFPLAIPLMAGPGSIAATMLLAARAGGDAVALMSLMAIVALVMAVTYLALIAAARISRVLGATGQSVLTRMLGVVLAALAVQFVIDGVRTVTG
jgi:multiple antibiotic resistance protein